MDGVRHEMAGILSFQTEMQERPQGRGYMRLKTIAGNEVWDIPEDMIVNAHEFHHSRIRVPVDSLGFLYNVERGSGIGGGFDGILQGGVLASYAHLHPAAAPWWAGSFVNAVLRSGMPGRARIRLNAG